MAAAITQNSKLNTQNSLLPPVVTFLLGIALWEGAVRGFNIPLYLLPAPSGIAETFLSQPGYLLRIGLYTFGEALAGFLLGCTFGSLLAAVCVRFRGLADALVPFSVASNAVPIVALSPLLGIWLGSTTAASKIGVVTIMTMFPTLVNVYRGLTAPTPDAFQLMRSYAARQRDVFLKLRLPAALPYLFTSLKVAATASVIGAIVAELPAGSKSGIAVMIINAAQYYNSRPTVLYVAVISAGLVGLCFYGMVGLAERLVVRERKAE